MYIKEKDVYQVYDGKKNNLTLQKIFDISGIEYTPKKKSFFEKLFKKDKDEIDVNKPIKKLFSVSDKEKLLTGKKYRVLITAKRSEKRKGARIKEVLDAGAVVISGVEDEELQTYPNFIKVEDGAEVWAAIGAYLRDMFNPVTVAITGSVGKSTTAQLTQSIFESQGETFHTRGNRNTFRLFVSEMISSLDENCDYIVQEVGGGNIKLVERGAKALKPNFFCITNVWGHHLRQYKTLERILWDKTSLDRYASEGAVGVINGDDELLCGYNFKSKVVKCGIKNTDCDYVADNIVQDGSMLKFDIHNDGNVYNIEVPLLGEYNAYNAMFAFAVAKEAGIDTKDIIKCIKNFDQTDRKRQFSHEVAGRTLIVDCFNVSANSILSGAQILDTYSKKEGNRIAFLGGENRVGKTAEKVNYQIGKDLSEFNNIDKFVIYGHSPDVSSNVADATGDSYSVYKGLVDNAKDVDIRYEHDTFAAAEILKKNTEPEDLVYFKGHVYYPMWPIIDYAFGTNYYYETDLDNSKMMPYGGMKIAKVKVLEAVVIKKSIKNMLAVTIPDTIKDLPVHAIGEKAFFKKTISGIDFGNSVKHIGTRSFAKVKGLDEVSLPESCLYIGEGAFSEAADLKAVNIMNVKTVDSYAFKDCKNLRKVRFETDCYSLGEDIFTGCDELVIEAPKGSRVEKYAIENNIHCESF